MLGLVSGSSIIVESRSIVCVCVCVLSSHLFWTSGLWTHQPESHRRKESHTGIIHLPSAVLALTFLARRIQPSLSLVDREIDLWVLTIEYDSIVLHLLGIFFFFFFEEKSQFV